MDALSHQSLFDKTFLHLVKQGRPALRGSVCMYRTPEGLSCAVGCHISDEEYDPKMDNHPSNPGGTSIHNILPRFPQLSRFKTFEDLLMDLQAIHDSNTNRHYDDTFIMDHIIYDMKRVADKYILNTKVIDDYTSKNPS